MAVMRHTKISIMLVVLTAITSEPEAAQTTAPPQTILAIGAHAGDMELTAGALRKPAFDIEVPLEDERRACRRDLHAELCLARRDLAHML